MPLKFNKETANTFDGAKKFFGIFDGFVFEFEQVGEFFLIEFFDARFNIFR